MKALVLISVLTSVVVAAWVLASLVLADCPTLGADVRSEVAYSFPLSRTVVLDYEPAGELKLRGFLDYRGGRLHSAHWFDAAHALVSAQTFGDGWVRSSERPFIYPRDGVLMPSPLPDITFKSTAKFDASGVTYESKEWWYADELLAREEPGRYSELLPAIVSGVVGVVAVALWATVVWVGRRRRQHPFPPPPSPA
jgi:hypothetical protein